MISTWAKWRISTAIEKGTPLSPALARKVRRDPECRRFYEASMAMAKRLRRDAVEVVRDEEERLAEAGPLELRPSTEIRSPRRVAHPWRPAWAATTATVVLAVVLGAGIWWWPSSRPVPDTKPPGVVPASDVAELAQIIRQIKGNVERVAKRKSPRWQQIAARSGEALRAPFVREAENVAADSRRILHAISSMIPSGENPEPSDSGDDLPPSSSPGRQ